MPWALFSVAMGKLSPLPELPQGGGGDEVGEQQHPDLLSDLLLVPSMTTHWHSVSRGLGIVIPREVKKSFPAVVIAAKGSNRAHCTNPDG